MKSYFASKSVERGEKEDEGSFAKSSRVWALGVAVVDTVASSSVSSPDDLCKLTVVIYA